jgi:hypothetical protein
MKIQITLVVINVFMFAATITSASNEFPNITANPSNDVNFRYVGRVLSAMDFDIPNNAIITKGQGSGVIVSMKSILTCAHNVFDYSDQSASNWEFYPPYEIWWDQAHDDINDFYPILYEPKQSQINGVIVFDSYSSRAISDPVYNSDGLPRPRVTGLTGNADVAILWAFNRLDMTNAEGAYVWEDGSNALNSNRNKIIAGYPGDPFPSTEHASLAGYTVQWQPTSGRFYSSQPKNLNFTTIQNEDGDPYLGGWALYASPDIVSSGGNSGGPVFVSDANGEYRVGGIYIGSFTNTTTWKGGSIVRAVTSRVIDLIHDAESASNWDPSGKPNVVIQESGAVLSGTVTLSARSDSKDVSKVRFYGSADGNSWTFIGEDDWPYNKYPYYPTGADWEVSMNTSHIGYDPSYYIKAVAIDYFGNNSDPSIKIVRIDNRDRPDYRLVARGGPLLFEGIAPGNTATLSYNVSNEGKNTVSFQPFKSASWISSVTPSHEVSIHPGGFQVVEVTVNTSGLPLGATRSGVITNSSPQTSVDNIDVSLLVAAGAENGKIKLFVTGDTFVDEFYRSQNWGADSSMWVSDAPSGSSRRRMWSLMQFDTTGLGNKNITVTNATLSIYCESLGNQAGAQPIYVHVPSNNWNEGTATGQTQAGSVTWNDMVVDPGAVQEWRDFGSFNIGTTGWREVDVTTWAKRVLGGSGSNRNSYRQKGMLLRYHGESNTHHHFRTREASRTASIELEFIEKDGIDPIVSITSHSDGQAVASNSISISGTAYDASGIDFVEVRLNSNRWLEASTNNNWANWSIPFTLSPGANTIEYYARDKTYQTSRVSSIVIHYNPPKFNIGVTPNEITLEQGSSSTVAVIVDQINGFNSSVNLTTSGLPDNVSATYASTSVTPPATTNLVFDVGIDAPLGVHNVTLTGEGGGLTDSIVFPLTIISLPKPTITTHPVNQTVTSPSEATFNVTASGIGLSYQWLLSTNSGSTWSDIPNATSATYSTGPTIISMSGYKYQCVVSNSAGSVTSNSATLTVDEPVQPPSIIEHPQDVVVTAPAPASFSLSASGEDIVYQWQFSTNSGATWSNIPDATFATYNLGETTASMNNNRYRCAVSNTAGSVTSNSVTLTVNPQIVVPTISTSPAINVTRNSATTGGNVSNDGGATVSERGVVYSTSENPALSNGTNIPGGSGTGSFTSNLSDLMPGTTYYVRAYATNSAGTAYGSQIIFTSGASPEPSTQFYTDALGDLGVGEIPHLDIDFVEVTAGNGGETLSFTLHLAGSPQEAGWGNYMIALNTQVGGDSVGNPWMRPISFVDGMTHMLGVWISDSVGRQAWRYSDSSWNLISDSEMDVSLNGNRITIVVPSSEIGLLPGSQLLFDVYTTGSSYDPGAIDALSTPNPTVTDWGDHYTTNPNGTLNGALSFVMPGNDEVISFDEWFDSPDVPMNRRGHYDSAANDGVANVVKYFQGIDPMDTRGLAGLKQMERPSPTQMRAWFLKSKVADDSVEGTVRWSRDLVNWYQSGATEAGTTVTLAMDHEEPDSTNPNREWVRVDATMNGAAPSALFLRLEVEMDSSIAEGFAPTFDELSNRVIGEEVLGGYFILDAARFSWGSFNGNWSYVITGANTGLLTFTYDGASPNVYREEVELKFTGSFIGTYVYREYHSDVFSEASETSGSFDYSGTNSNPDGFILHSDDFSMFSDENSFPAGWTFSGPLTIFAGEWGEGTASGFRGGAGLLGYQHTANTGLLSKNLLVENSSGQTVDTVTIEYVGRVAREDAERNPAYAVFVDGVEIPELAYSTRDGDMQFRASTISGLNLAAGEFVEIQWQSDRGDGSGASKQIGIADIRISVGAKLVAPSVPCSIDRARGCG